MPRPYRRRSPVERALERLAAACLRLSREADRGHRDAERIAVRAHATRRTKELQ